MAKTSPPCSSFWAEMEQLQNCFPINDILNSNIIGEDVTPLDLLQNFMYEWKSPENQPKKDGQEGGESKPAEDPLKQILTMIGADVTPMEILQNMCSGPKPTPNCPKTGAKDPNGQFNNGVKIDPLQTVFNILSGKTCPKSADGSNSSPNSMNLNPDVSATCCKDSKQDDSECSKNSKPDSLENPKSNSTGNCCEESTQSAEIDPLQAIFSMLGVKLDRENDAETISRSSKQPNSECCSNDSNGINSCDNFFKFEVDVKEFTPEELSVKLVGNSVVVEAKHDEKEDGSGFVSRQFTRRFPIPEGYNLDLIKSTLSTQGILQIKIPKDNVYIERIIPVVRTGSYVL